MKKFKNDAWESLSIALHHIRRITIRVEKHPSYEAVEIDIDRGKDYPKATVTLFGHDIEIRGIKKTWEKELLPAEYFEKQEGAGKVCGICGIPVETEPCPDHAPAGEMKEPEAAERSTCLWCKADTGGCFCPNCGASVCLTCLDASDEVNFDIKVCPDCSVKREKDRDSRTEALREDASERRRELAAEDQRVRDAAGEPGSEG